MSATMTVKQISAFNCSTIETKSSNKVQSCTNLIDNSNWFVKGYNGKNIYILNHILGKNFYNLFEPSAHEAILMQGANNG